MALKKALVLDSLGNMEELQSGDTIPDPSPDSVVYTAQENLSIRDAVYQHSTADNVAKADASSDSTMECVGLAKAAATSSNPVEIVHEGEMGGFSGLTIGADLFVSTSTPGAITETVPTSSGHVVQKIGYALTATSIMIKLESPMKLG